MRYGLIGATLGHSYSPQIHKMLGNPDYQLYALPKQEDVQRVLCSREFCGLNVTMPYKQFVIPLCDWVDPAALQIGAVNTLVHRDGKLYGYNTDLAGLEYLLTRHHISLRDKCVMILGTGGTCHTAMAAVRRQQPRQVLVVSRSGGPGTLTYEQAAKRTDVQVVVNTTPAGMAPHAGSCLLELSCMTGLEAVVDVVYNPFKTELVLRAEERGIPAVGGFEMLVAQAVYADQLFRGVEHSQDTTERIYRSLLTDMVNVSLVGMPGSGKTAVGCVLAQKLNKKFVDLDREIEKQAGKSIAQIFSDEGQAAFRRLESRVTEQFAAQSGQVLSCGGGVVLNPENVHRLRQNGPVLLLQRDPEQLELGHGRPLSTDRAALAQMQKERDPLYKKAADAQVANHAALEDAVQAAAEAFYEIIDPERAEYQSFGRS